MIKTIISNVYSLHAFEDTFKMALLAVTKKRIGNGGLNIKFNINTIVEVSTTASAKKMDGPMTKFR